jgi:transposase-like protein
MNENHGSKNNRHSNRSLSVEEKRNYCIAWKKSGMNQLDFSKANGISKSALYKWNKEFEKENKDIEFSPITLKDKPHDEQTGVIQLNIECPNHIRLSISIPEYRLISFIQEIGYATSTIW